MSVNETKPGKVSNSLQIWVVTIMAVLVSFVGLTVTLMCVPSTHPVFGAIFFLGSVIITLVLIFFTWRKNPAKHYEIASMDKEIDSSKTVLKEGTSDKVIKWLVTLFSLMLLFTGLVATLMCIGDNNKRTLAGSIYFISCGLFLLVFIYVIWKNCKA